MIVVGRKAFVAVLFLSLHEAVEYGIGPEDCFSLMHTDSDVNEVNNVDQ